MLAGLLLVLCSTHAGAFVTAKVTERSKQKSQVEGERTQLQQKLTALKSEIDRTEVAKDSAAATLSEAENAISNANRSLLELSVEQNQTEQKLKQLAQEQKKISAIVKAQQQQLATLLRGQYVAGNEDRIKLLLSGDNPNRINRDLQYLGYLSQAQASLLASLRTNLAAVESNQAESQNAKDELTEIVAEAREQKTVLENEKGRRSILLSQLSSRLTAQRKEAGNLERDDQRLGGLVDKLAKLIEEQKKIDAAALEQRRLQQLAQAQAKAAAESARLARLKAEKEQRRNQLAKASAHTGSGRDKPNKQDKSGKPYQQDKQANPNPADAIDADAALPKEATQSIIKNELTPVATVQDGLFASLRGSLHLPLRGTLVAKFGSKRGDGPNSKGVFIRAAEGTEVKAVAGGRVVFAEWLRGFGNLMIVDHGSQYMTIYGNNQTLLKRAGDAVKTGDTLASAGNSGSNDESGLYFEMRHQGRAFDPLGWVTIR
jgi:septal ring factor EnvC (AmiA/AmiB activator)